ncbi:5'-nucleotidase [Pollutibacter soli]|uniref:5'-nucleotidase n=1 Tax=Pollutibacter soli TaxID=3034157 RepID=UPI0030139B67
MSIYRRLFFSIAVCIVLGACQRQYVPQKVDYSGYNINVKDSGSKNLQDFLQPYKDSVAKLMDKVVGTLDSTLKNSTPDGTLGNFIADAYLTMAKQKFNPNAAISFMNIGGIRLGSIPAGPVKRGKIYEVMPFDNEMYILEVPGNILREYLDAIAGDRGGGVAGIKFQIADKKAINITINGKPLDTTARYIMVNSDYVVNGGGNFYGLKDLKKERTGYLLRNAILDYIAEFTSRNQPIKIPDDKRITSAN